MQISGAGSGGAAAMAQMRERLFNCRDTGSMNSPGWRARPGRNDPGPGSACRRPGRLCTTPGLQQQGQRW